MSSRIDRFKKRKEIKDRNQSLPLVRGLVDQALVDNLLEQPMDLKKIEDLDYSTDLNISFEISLKEADALILDLKKSLNKKRLDQLLDETKRGVVLSIAGPFGLGKIISAYDKTGGNVTTINNANNGIYAKDEDRYIRENYTHTKNSSGNQFANAGKNSSGASFTRLQMDEHQMVQDAYTGKRVKADTTSPDHIESLSQYHKNGGFMQTSEQKADFATDYENLALTDRSINKSMSDLDKQDWAAKKNADGVENKDRFDIDEKKLNAQREKGKISAETHLPTNKEKTEFYFKNAIDTGVSVGVNMGVQQAFGYLLVEFFSSSMIEIRNAYDEGLEGENLYKDIKIRLTRIGENLTHKWKNIIEEFSIGFLSGFISNLVTTIVNTFKTTTKRLVRMIREGVFSLLKALKLMLFPPAHMNFREVAHEVIKLIASGGIIIAGVALEEVIEKFLVSFPFLTPFASIAVAVIVGSITAIAMSLVAYLIDKMDILGVIKASENNFLLERLDTHIDEKLRQCESISEEIQLFLDQNTPLLLESSS